MREGNELKKKIMWLTAIFLGASSFLVMHAGSYAHEQNIAIQYIDAAYLKVSDIISLLNNI